MPELTAFEREGGDTRQFHQAESQRLGNALHGPAGTDDRADIGEGGKRRIDVGRERRLQRRKRRLRIDAQAGEDRQMQGQRDGEAAGCREGGFGAAGRHQRGHRLGKPRCAVERHAEDVVAHRLGREPASDLGALARLRGDDHGFAGDRQGLGELFGERQGNRIHAKRAIERLDDARRGVRGAHAEEQQAAGRADRFGGRGRLSAGPFERIQRIACLAGHLALDGRAAGVGLSLDRACHPLTPPWVRPEISARCMTRPMSTGGSAASTPAVAIRP